MRANAPRAMTIARLTDLADAARLPAAWWSRSARRCSSSRAARRGANGSRRWWQRSPQRAARGQQVIVVSSGAIALGAARLGLDKGGRGSLADAQAAAAVGQIALAGLWAELLGAHGIDRGAAAAHARAISKTAAATSMPPRRSGGCSSRARCRWSTRTIASRPQEIRFGDNDRLAARVAQAAQAERGAAAVRRRRPVSTAIRAQPGAQLAAAWCRASRTKCYAMATDGFGLGHGLGRDDVEAAGGRDRRTRRDRAGDRQRHA